MGNVRTDQVKRTAKELVRRFPDKFTANFEENKLLVSKLLQGVTTKIRNQIAGYITHGLAAELEEEEAQSEEGTEATETEEGEAT